MDKNKVMKIFSAVLPLVGAGVSVAASMLDKKEQEEKIAEKAQEAVEKILNKKES